MINIRLKNIEFTANRFEEPIAIGDDIIELFNVASGTHRPPVSLIIEAEHAESGRRQLGAAP